MEIRYPDIVHWDYDCVVPGEPASSKNQRRIVRARSGSPRLIKSAKALAYWDAIKLSAPILDPMLQGDLYVHIDAYYASRRPDLSCLEIIKDALQGVAYPNDRQVKMESAVWNLNRSQPHVRIRIREIGSSGCIETYSSLLCATLDLA